VKNQRIRLAQITHDLAIGGLQQVVVNLCRTIDRERFDVIVVCLRALGAYVPEVERMGIRVRLVPQKQNGTDYFSFLKLANILKEEKIEVIHTHNTQPFFDGTIAGLLAGVRTIIHTDHARNFPDKRRYMFAEWLMSHFASKIVGVSEHTSRNLMKFERISAKKIVTIPNGIYGSQYKIVVDKEKKKKELGIKGNGPILGVGVRLTEQKGITYLLKAMPKVIREFPDATLVIAGQGPLEPQLKREAVELKVKDNVFFLGPRLDMPEILKLLDIYVLPSLWEGLPMVILEAMASGCPIIATDVGGNSTAIQNRSNGSLVKAKDAQELSMEIIKLLRDKELRVKYVTNGTKIFDEKYSAEIMTKQYEELYLNGIQ
jgi:glycosyltransferase involved in cell wall biosynthesis